MNVLTRVSLLACLVAGCGFPAGSCAEDSSVAVATGVYVTSGDYGSERTIEDLYVPLTITADLERVGLRLTVPYLELKAPEGTIITGPGGEPIPGTGPMITTSGLGDVLASITLYDVIASRSFAIDLTGKIKFGTADESDGLGTGETDYTLQMEFYRFLDRATLTGSLGYTLRGDPAAVDLDDILIASVGGYYELSDATSAGLFFDYRESSFDDFDAAQELTVVLSRHFGHGWRLQAQFLAGFTDNSPEWGAGIQVRRTM